MEWRVPTSVSDLSSLLKEVALYYLERNDEYEAPTFDKLNLERLNTYNFTEDEYSLMAENYYISAREDDDVTYKEAQIKELSNLKGERAKIVIDNANKRAEIIRACHENIIKAENSTSKNNLGKGSTILLEAIKKYEELKRADLLALDKDLNLLLVVIDEKIKKVEENIKKASTKYNSKYSQLIYEKSEEYKKYYLEKNLEIQKYNNGLIEKELKYNNALEKSNADLALKKMEILSQSLSEDQKITKGYYQDMVNVIDSYYSKLEPSVAYTEFQNQAEYSVYLGSYYQNYLYLLYRRTLA